MYVYGFVLVVVKIIPRSDAFILLVFGWYHPCIVVPIPQTECRILTPAYS